MRMVFLGSMTKTERMVKAMPFSSTLVASWWSILQYLSQHSSLVTLAFHHRVYAHVVEQRNLPLLVADDGELQPAAGDLVDVLDPAAMALDGVGAQADELDVPLRELGLELREGAELGGADGRVVFGVGEEDDPGGRRCV